MEQYKYYWQKVCGNEKLKLDLELLKKACEQSFRKESDNYKQKLVFKLLEAVKNNDQIHFFYTLLRAINRPDEEFKQLQKLLHQDYDVMPNEVFTNFAYTIILGIMSTYGETGGEKK